MCIYFGEGILSTETWYGRFISIMYWRFSVRHYLGHYLGSMLTITQFAIMIWKTMIIFLFSGGRRGNVSLCSILKFATGSEEEPVLGFHIYPSIAFVKNASLVPTSTTCTCINKLNLPIPHGNMEVPSQDILFNLYDYAFCNAYFGLQ